MILLTAILGLAAGILLLPSISELLSLLRLPFTRPVRHPPGPKRQPVFLFLVPAHDEELLLPSCLRSLFVQQYPADLRRVVVVADNCSDRTADVARAAGAEVLERQDASRRGKPWGIAWALGRVDLQAVDGVVIIDADTEVAPGFASALAARAPLSHKVLQPFIGVQNPDDNALTRMAAVHERAGHGLAYRVKERVGLNVPLGVGMCIGRDVLLAEPWSAFSICEDWELYAIFSARGVRIEPVAEARIVAQEARSLGQSAPQRHRWMAGRREVLLRYARRLLTSPNIGAAQRFDAVAELAGVGPVVQLGLALSGAMMAWLAHPPWGSLIGWLFVVSLLRPTVYTLLAIAYDPAPLRALRAFLFLPVYAAWRLGPAVRSLVHGGPWIRTGRHAASSSNGH